ncbi:glyoxalase/bleomycin resistance/extradiol dioxygenase family protein [Kerstersia gyiorum]|uniref:VOC family protein n=1 Tax=Kerstersia gyiorum TaxID=206506 RepID=UPI0010708698|nr:VOC family protein [Kerstersia gyiorum]QBR39489.1 glyoxalase/bleomycin resistance/extradiol dioxygenase family protein [Kerstersia gyiorum]
MINLHDIRYVRLGTKNLGDARRYATEILGLQVAREANGAIYFRSDDRDHTLCYYEGDPNETTTAFEVTSPEELESAAVLLEQNKFHVVHGSRADAEVRYVDDLIRFQDPSGNNIELVLRPQASGRRYFASRDAGITGFSHIGLRTLDARRDEQFWTGLASARVSDRIGEAPLLRIDEVHHKIALFPSKHPGVQHINHQVESIDDVMRAYYFLLSRGVKILFGPGRHPTSGAVFLYFEGPDGMTYEYSTGVSHISPEQEATHQPRQFPGIPESFCMWGAKPDIPEFRS